MDAEKNGAPATGVEELLARIVEETVCSGAALPQLYRLTDRVLLLLDPSPLLQTGEMQAFLSARGEPESSWRPVVDRLFGKSRIDRRRRLGTLRISGPSPADVWERMAGAWAGESGR